MMFPALFILPFWIQLFNCDIIPTSEFIQRAICDVTEKISKGCAEGVVGPRSLAECAYMCDQQIACIGSGWTDQGKCILHQDCSNLVGKCKVENKKHRFMAKPCGYGATWDTRFQFCKCPRGMHGTMCEKYPQNCINYIEKTDSADIEKITIDPQQDGVNLYLVLCSDRPPLADRIFLSRNEGWADFNKTWAEYTNGFYIDNNNLFIGLEVLYQLTKIGYTSLTVYAQFDDPKADASMRYSGFTLSDKSKKYKFTYQMSVGGSVYADFIPTTVEVHSCFYLNRKKMFTTWDNDNDSEPDMNCAAITGMGWWFAYKGKECKLYCNLLGASKANWAGKDKLQKMSMRGLNMNKYGSRIEQLVVDIVKK